MNTEFSIDAAASAPASGGGSPRRDTTWRRGAIAVGALLLVTESVVAARQAPRPVPLQAPSFGSVAWWRYPVQRNAVFRIPVARGPVLAVYAQHGTSNVWISGAGGLVARSTDGGDTWTSTNLRAAPQIAALVARPAAPSANGRTGPRIPNRSVRQVPATKKAVYRERRPRRAGVPVTFASFSRWQGIATPQSQQQQQQQQSVAVPNLMGQDSASAIKVLSGLKLQPELGTAPAYSRTQSGRVIEQYPQGGERVAPASVVRVTIGRYASDVVAQQKPQTGLPAVPKGDPNRPRSDTARRSPRDSTPSVAAATSRRFYPRLSGICFADAVTGWVVGEAGAAFRTSNGGTSWTQVATNTESDFTTLTCSVALGAIATDASGRVYAIRDTSVPRGLMANAASTAIAARDNVWAVSYLRADTTGAGTSSLQVSVSRDTGRSWAPGAYIALRAPASIAFADSLHGLIVDAARRVVRTSNGGGSWSSAHSCGTTRTRRFAMPAVAAASGASVLLTDGDGRLYASRDSAATCDALARVDSSVVVRLAAASEEAWFAVAGGVFRSTDGGRSWQSLISTARFDSISFADSLHGRALLEGGVTVQTSNGGRSWRIDAASSAGAATIGARPHAQGALVHSVANVAGVPHYALDTLGALLQSADSGRTWRTVPTGAPSSYPAPWYYGAVLLTVGGALAAPRLRRKPEPAKQSIADVLVSDRPLREGDRDVLDFGKIAAGLSRFIRNSRTEPPLTLAITGPWGTGKSSLMNLLRRDLERRRFRTIWFNAWHHQREESLLASLLESIRLTATPPVWTPKGFRFRCRLLLKRIARYRVPALLLLPVFGFAVGYILHDPTQRWLELGNAYSALKAVFTNGGKAPADLAAKGTLLAVIISIAGTIVTYLRGLKAFGVKPQELAKSVVAAGRVRTIEAQPAFRYRFAQDFSEVTQALKPERIVIFIDDLDRCKPEQVLEILEAINFLAESGDCVIVLGIDRQRVTGCVAIGFKEVATVLADTRITEQGGAPPRIGAPQPKSDIEYQLEYAKNYLEKLLNMEVPVPPATAAELGQVMTSAGPLPRVVPDDASEAAEELRERELRRMRGGLFTAAVTLLAAAAFVFGLRGNLPDAASGARSMAPATVADSQPAVALTNAVSRPSRSASTPSPLSRGERRVTPLPLVAGETSAMAWWASLLSTLVAIGAIIWLITPREENRVDDSPAFATALKAWAPVLFARHPTPRSAKKFLNRLRFLSMAERVPSIARSPAETAFAGLMRIPWIRRLLDILGGEEPADDVQPPSAIPEAILVSLNVIREHCPEWLSDDAFWTSTLDSYARKRSTVQLDVASAIRALPGEDANRLLISCRDEWKRLAAWVRDA